MNIDLKNEYELTDEFLNNHSLDDVVVFSFAEEGANGTPGNIEAVVKMNDKEIKLITGSYMWGNEKLSREKVYDFFNLDNWNPNNPDWDALNMGLGNCLFVRKEYASYFHDKYDKLIEQLPFFLYETWKKYAYYVLEKEINNKKAFISRQVKI